MDGVKPDDTTKFTRCKECLQPTTAVRYFPYTLLHQMVAFARTSPPHVLGLDELMRICDENGIPRPQ